MSPVQQTRLQQARIWQIRLFSRWLVRLSKVPGCRPVIEAARPLLHPLVGYRRPFRTLREAENAIARYSAGGHSNPDNARIHLDLAKAARPSDYAALFHMRALLPELRHIYDFGGNAGNLYYCYSKYLDFPLDLQWSVYDLPPMLAVGRQVANGRGERRLRFTGRWDEAAGADLLIASGSLHYFPKPLPEMIAGLKEMPRYVFVNRTPLVEGRTAAAVQDAGSFLVACLLYNRSDLIRGFEMAGYELVDSWRAEEMAVSVPCYPEYCVPAYSGMFLRLKSTGRTTGTHLELLNYLPIQS